ncbi:MAG TPA: proline dehydrogenase family protein [Gaiellaceae bacterium]|nr:proline dehydrogenase family protein [Gaiellaceae bacterium]
MRVADRAIVRILPAVPRSIVRRLSAPYIAGATLEDARALVARLNAEGKLATVDVLGEEVTVAAEAEAVASAYHAALDAIAADRLDANVSVKLTALGLELDLGLCRSLLATVVADAAARGIFVRIDMEHSGCTDDTLRLYRELRESGRDNVGIVLQSYLRRTLADVGDIIDLRPSVRLCKGIYVEPASSAYTGRQQIRDNFLLTLDALLEAGSYVAVATHDEWLIERSLPRLAGLERDAYELQMLLGVREERATELVAEGHRLRVYVPYGDRWYEYSLRRLQENPAVAGMVAKATLLRVVPGRG